MTTNRKFLSSAAILVWIAIFSQTALAAQSKAQLYMPWPMLNTKLNTVLSGSNSSFSTKVPSSTLDAGGFLWSITNITYEAATNAPTSHTNGSVIAFEANNSSLKVTIQKIAVDQIIEKEINGAIVRIHLVADCGPLTFTQPKASVSSLFDISWSSGSPVASLKNSALSWVQNSWVINDFACNGPNGLSDILKTNISDRLRNADDFKPYLTEFLTSEVHGLITNTLNKVREPLTVTAASSRQTFKVGVLYNLPQGVVADLTVSDSSHDDVLPPAALPSPEILNALPSTTPSFLAGKELLEQIIRSEFNAQAASVKTDLQSVPSFHALMQDRIKQLFGWADLRKYPKNSPFPLTMFKPKFEGLAVTSANKLKTTFDLNGVAQSYRENQWWNWLVIKGKTSAEVSVTVANGRVTYNTTVTPLNTTIKYGPEYTKTFKKDSDPPQDKILAAVTGAQPKLSGTYKFPVIELAQTGAYKLSSIKWIGSKSFILNWTQN